jgi:ABC-2 type transport system permease protein
MIASALFYYQYHSVKNRLAARVKRLRDPKYLVGAIVGGMYFYFYLLRAFLRGGRGAVAPVHGEMFESIAAIFLMVAVLLAWIVPHSRSALSFTEAEAAFLFPAPITRLTLINFKLLKSQMTIFFSSLLMTIIGRGLGGGNFLTRAVGWWALLSVFNLHLLGSSFALTMLMDRGISNWKRRAIFLGVVGAAVVAVYLWVRATLPAFPAGLGAPDLKRITDYGRQVLQAGPIPWLLLPFRLVVAPYFAADMGQFLRAIGPALAIIGLHYWWVTRSNVAFEEASLERSRRDAERIAAVRSGNWRALKMPKKAARPPFALSPVGNPAVAVLWKNLVSSGQYVTMRVWILLIWCAIIVGGILRSTAGHGVDLQMGILFFAGLLAGMSLISGPQMLRNDLRQDLPAADLLKMYPMPGWQIVLGEVLAPAVMLAAVQWVLIVVAVVVCPREFHTHPIWFVMRLAAAAAAAVVLPFVDVIAMLIPNASVLFFPAWFQLGKEGPRGFETTGQQIILVFGQMLVLIVSLLPAGIAFAALFFGSSFFLGNSMGLFLGGIAAAVVLAGEAALGIKLLGGVFERLDLSEENL